MFAADAQLDVGTGLASLFHTVFHQFAYAIPVQDLEGKHYEALVLDKQDGLVTLDFNEPLAGETLHFRGKVLEVRPASEEDVRLAMDES